MLGGFGKILSRLHPATSRCYSGRCGRGNGANLYRWCVGTTTRYDTEERQHAARVIHTYAPAEPPTWRGYCPWPARYDSRSVVRGPTALQRNVGLPGGTVESNDLWKQRPRPARGDTRALPIFVSRVALLFPPSAKRAQFNSRSLLRLPELDQRRLYLHVARPLKFLVVGRFFPSQRITHPNGLDSP